MRTVWNVKALLALPLAVVLATALADDKTLSKEQLAGKLNGVEPTDISDSPVKGLYQISLGGNVAYITTDGHYLFRGDIYDADTSANITEETRSHARVAMLASVDPKSMIVFKPKNGQVKHVVTVFTDVDCGYCRQFHREIDKVTALGIEVHYLFFPRTPILRPSDHCDSTGVLPQFAFGRSPPSLAFVRAALRSGAHQTRSAFSLSLIHISEPTRRS